MDNLGVWPAMVTPLSEAGAISLSSLGPLVDVYARQRLGGLYILGSTGQGPLLSMAEREAVAKVAVETADGRLPVIVHVGAATTEESCELARHAEAIGADAVSCTGPMYYQLPAAAIFEHYRQVGRASGLPLYVYQIDLVSQPGLSVQEYTARLRAVPNIAGLKITSGDLYQFGLIHHYAPELKLFSGHDEVLCHALLSGACGAIGTFYGIWGPECKQAREAIWRGDVTTAARFMERFQAAIRDVLAGGRYGFTRAAILQRYGIDTGAPRAPLGCGERAWDTKDVKRILESVRL